MNNSVSVKQLLGKVLNLEMEIIKMSPLAMRGDKFKLVISKFLPGRENIMFQL